MLPPSLLLKMDVALTILLIIFGVIILIFRYFQSKLYHWRHQNVRLISFWDFVGKTKLKPWGLVINDYYQEMLQGDESIRALEVPLISLIIVSDQQAIKDIMLTQYESFPDRGLYANPRDYLSSNIARLDYDLWKPLRQKLSPCFSPAKSKYVFPTMLEVSERLVDVLKDKCLDNLNSQFNIYDLCASFSTDIMTQVIFGIESNSLRDPQDEFRLQFERVFYQMSCPLKDHFGTKFSKIMKFFNMKIFENESIDFFTHIVKENMEYRKKHKITRRDFMEIFMNMKSDCERNGDFSVTLEVLVGHVFAMIAGGFETTTCAMAYSLYEIAKNTEIQEKVHREVVNVIERYNHQITYESLKDMKYLSQVIMETLRKYPTLPNMSRVCRRRCNLQTTKGPVTIPLGTSVILPFYAIQHNPNFYPEPEVFRPERFDELEIAERPPCTFLAFGYGPKACLGEVFSKMYITLGLAQLLSKFRFSVSDKTPDTLIFDPKNVFILFAKGGVPLQVEKV